MALGEHPGDAGIAPFATHPGHVPPDPVITGHACTRVLCSTQPLLNNSVQIPDAFQSSGLAYEYLSAQNYMASRLAKPTFNRLTGEVRHSRGVWANRWAHTCHRALLQATAARRRPHVPSNCHAATWVRWFCIHCRIRHNRQALAVGLHRVPAVCHVNCFRARQRHALAGDAVQCQGNCLCEAACNARRAPRCAISTPPLPRNTQVSFTVDDGPTIKRKAVIDPVVNGRLTGKVYYTGGSTCRPAHDYQFVREADARCTTPVGVGCSALLSPWGKERCYVLHGSVMARFGVHREARDPLQACSPAPRLLAGWVALLGT